MSRLLKTPERPLDAFLRGTTGAACVIGVPVGIKLAFTGLFLESWTVTLLGLAAGAVLALLVGLASAGLQMIQLQAFNTLARRPSERAVHPEYDPPDPHSP